MSMPSTPRPQCLCATAEETGRLAREVCERQQLPGSAFRPLGKTGLITSAIGFGGYRIDSEGDTHRGALEQALRRGVNLIDTSSNYTDGASESLIGEVLGGGSAEAEKLRPRIILVSKVGYVQGRNMKVVEEAINAGRPFPDMVEYQSSCWHCIHPTFIADQLERSLARLQVSTLDVYLLHNPEYFFSDWKNRKGAGTLDTAREEFYRRVAEAFVYLEECIAEGKIQWYGVSSNTFGEMPGHPEFVSLETLIRLGAEAAGQAQGEQSRSGFAVAQCPLNLYESGPLLNKNQQDAARSFLQLAKAENIGVLVNRPLNVIREGRLTRLADFPVPRQNVEQEIEFALDALQAEEQTFAALFRPDVASGLPEDAGPYTPFEWSGPVRRGFRDMHTREHWNLALNQQIYPHLQYASRFVLQAMKDKQKREDFTKWYPEYCRKLEQVAGMITEWLSREDHEHAQRIHKQLAPLLADGAEGLPLSQKALLTLLALPGVSCVLNGIRRASYVEDSTATMALEPWGAGQGEHILRELARADAE